MRKTNKEYQEEVEKKYGKPIKEIMNELVIKRHMDQWDGATELGVPKETFVTWRTKFRLGPDQRREDFAERMRNKTLESYKKELENVDFERSFDFKDEKSLRGFKEIIERMIELEKKRRLLHDFDNRMDIVHSMRVSTLESIILYLNQYHLSELHETFNYDLKNLKPKI
ncbi:hypothetical protein I6N90_24200 [Paenibacillus sp. GSMTC-2017]|uniref:hypothetical protein n=1 Tax=Paenibacillus sp. GSMTC-2017 TaxID=2794350 RepID=UPI0018D9A17B|nr:hypothetical protein [Paenibacillus sp. GSMTC-2017]MBH5320894.1 hypothetical protein [Paenibacillus sp. GSMTC-2017]